MADLFKVSQTKIRKFRTCRRAYHLSYVDGWKKIVKARPLRFGGIIHEMLEAFAEGKDPFAILANIAKVNKKLFADERELYGNIIEDIRVIMGNYFRVYTKKSLRFIKHQGKAAEHKLEVDIGEGFLFVFRVDHFGQTENGLRWLVENKTFSRKPSEDQRWRDLQTCMYLRACDMLGITKLNGVLWNYIKSKAPTRSEALKDGIHLSKRKIDTLPETVLSVIKEHGLKEKDCKDQIQQAKYNVNSYFDRVFTPIVPQVVDILFKEFLETCFDIRDQHGDLSDRSIGQHCGWCEFEPLCRTELTGGDLDYIKEHEYEQREDIQAEDEQSNENAEE